MLKKVIIISVNAFCLICFAVCLAISSSVITPLRSQQANDLWAGQSGERFAQLSVFFSGSGGYDMNDVYSLRDSLDRTLRTDSFDVTGNRVLYTDAWSAECEVSLLSERGPSTIAKAIAVGGDFFLFHPLNLRSGSYLSPNDVMKDRVVLDEELAWRLFGAIDIAGFELMLNDRPFIVAGVVSRESDFANSKAYTYDAGLFITYDTLLNMTDGAAKIETYEIVLPNPLTGYALTMLTEKVTDPNALIVENSTRFSLGNTFSRIGSFGERSMRQEAIKFPYWENAALFAEDWVTLLLVLSLFFIAFPIICTIIYLVLIIRYLVRRSKKAVRHMIDEKDKRAYDKYILEQNETEDKGNEIEHIKAEAGETVYNVNEIIREVQDETV